jgi:Mg2+-importing ATPase
LYGQCPSFGKPWGDNGGVAEEPAFWDMPLEALLAELAATPAGLSEAEAARRRRRVGPNTLVPAVRWAPLRAFVGLFLNPLVIILLLAAGVSLLIGERVNAVIILIMVGLSVLLDAYQESRAQAAAAELQRQVETTATVVRDGFPHPVPASELVPGDVVRLAAGDLVPADLRLLEARALQVREAALTGESLPVEKHAGALPAGAHTLLEAANSLFLGTAVESGLAVGVVARTGCATAYGTIAARVAAQPTRTEFDRGLHDFGVLLARLILIMAIMVFAVNALFYHPVFPSFLFAVALAVGLTPELLPMVISVTLAQGARRMAARKVIVKRLAAIENLGAMAVLCSDKTGTLTEGEIVLERHVNILGIEEERILHALYVNSYFETGIKSPLDDAILRHGQPDMTALRKVDEIPFDFQRRRLSVVVEDGDGRTLVTKGEVESLLDTCDTVLLDDAPQPFTIELRDRALDLYQRMSAEGFRLLGVARRTVPVQARYTTADEHGLTLVGFGAFLDPPKPGAADALMALRRDGIRVLVMTGDNPYVTRTIATEVGLADTEILTGAAVETLDDAALAACAGRFPLFARMTPEHKLRVITTLRDRGVVVGVLGDGINDAPALHAADIGISVTNGVQVAKAAADIILLEKDLGVLHDGVLEGRRSFANFMKYVTMSTSANVGNVLATAAGSLALPFLPMLPTQIILNNLLYDIAQVSIPTDTVADAEVLQPRRWQVDALRRTMFRTAPVVMLLNGVIFLVLLFALRLPPPAFRTAWFTLSLATQILVIYVIRRPRPRPSAGLLLTTLGVVFIGAGLPYTPLAVDLGFVPLGWSTLLILALLAAGVLGVTGWLVRRSDR